MLQFNDVRGAPLWALLRTPKSAALGAFFAYEKYQNEAD